MILNVEKGNLFAFFIDLCMKNSCLFQTLLHVFQYWMLKIPLCWSLIKSQKSVKPNYRNKNAGVIKCSCSYKWGMYFKVSLPSLKFFFTPVNVATLFIFPLLLIFWQPSILNLFKRVCTIVSLYVGNNPYTVWSFLDVSTRNPTLK